MSTPRLSVIVPAYNCVPTLRRALAALQASDLLREHWELIVADDGSTDNTPLAAAAVADRVVTVAGGPTGPGNARNEAARLATGDVLVFIDADVCVSPTALSQFDALFRDDPALGAAFGAYDTSPDAPSLVSQYRNLLHHYVHSLSPGPAITFWAGCGAMRREVFEDMGGFDVQRYTRPQIEDIELGYRLAARGIPILLKPDIQGKHLKRWTLMGGFVTDFRDRGVPWMQLLMERREVAAAGPLNLQAREKVFTALAPLGLAMLVAAGLYRSWPILMLGVAALGIVVAGNASLLGWFVAMRGRWFAFRIIPLRLVYYVLNACSGAWGAFLYLRGGGRGNARTNDTLSTSRARS